jgi:hypothetical protein
MCTSSIRLSMHHPRKCRLVSSGSLSQRITFGTRSELGRTRHPFISASAMRNGVR